MFAPEGAVSSHKRALAVFQSGLLFYHNSCGISDASKLPTTSRRIKDTPEDIITTYVGTNTYLVLIGGGNFCPPIYAAFCNIVPNPHISDKVTLQDVFFNISGYSFLNSL